MTRNLVTASLKIIDKGLGVSLVDDQKDSMDKGKLWVFMKVSGKAATKKVTDNYL